MNSEMKHAGMALAISLVPYSAVAWWFAAYVNGGSWTFIEAIGVLLTARLFFSIIEGFGGILVWRFCGKKVAIDSFLRSLRVNKFPPRYYEQDDFSTYLSRVRDDLSVSQTVQCEAKIMESMLAMCESAGILIGIRWHAAGEIALEAYSPRALAPVFEVPKKAT
jgi:hypothetical protein